MSKNRRRSSLSMEAGVSIAQRDAEAESTKQAYVRDVVDPILEALAMKFHEADAGQTTQPWEDVVKDLITWVEQNEGVERPEEAEFQAPDPSQVTELKQSLDETKAKLREINTLEKKSQGSGTSKVQGMVRKISLGRRLSSSKGSGFGSK